jgi:hypothetical protein
MVPELSNVVGVSASCVAVVVVVTSLEQPVIISNNIIDKKYLIFILVSL